MDCTQNGLYNLKQYDHYTIKYWITWTYHTIVYYIYVLNENYACKSQYIKKNTYVYKQKNDQRVNLLQKCCEYYDTWANRILFITQDDSSICHDTNIYFNQNCNCKMRKK